MKLCRLPLTEVNPDDVGVITGSLFPVGEARAQFHVHEAKIRMISKAPDVKTYIAEVPTERRAAIKKLRALCRKTLAGYQECMEYGMPGYKRDGVLEVSFASQKQSISMYVLKKDVVDEFRKALPTASIGKGCIRFANQDKIDFEVLERLLRRNASSKAAPC